MHDTYIDLLNSQSPYSSAYSSPFRLSEHDSYYHRASLGYSQSPYSSAYSSPFRLSEHDSYYHRASLSYSQSPQSSSILTQNPSDSTNLIPISTIIDELDHIFIEGQSEV
jgi:hypothetical protein